MKMTPKQALVYEQVTFPIVFVVNSWVEGDGFIERTNDIIDWLVDTFGYSTRGAMITDEYDVDQEALYVVRWIYDHDKRSYESVAFLFRREKDAMLYKLRWSDG